MSLNQSNIHAPSAATKLILGIDPGIKGAYAFLDPSNRKLVAFGDIPLTEKLEKKWIDIPAWNELMSPFMANTTFCVMEQPNSLPGQGVSSMFRFGHACGIAEGLVGAHGVMTYLVKPAVWKSILGLTGDKSWSRAEAKQKFPDQYEYFNNKKADGRAESALLAYFGMKNLMGKADLGLNLG